MWNQKLSKFFVGIKFSESSTLSRKIQGFRKRFDPKFDSHGFMHMSLHAPVEIMTKDKHKLVGELKEELEVHFYGDETSPKLALQGLGVHESRRQYILYLNPLYPESLYFCMESIKEICESFVAPSVNYKRNDKQFLPIGYFGHWDQVHKVMESAQEEFKANSELAITGISLFEKKFGVWSEVESLISFNQTDFLQLQTVSL